MSTVVIIGSQWGDEGKGKVTDFLAEEADVVVRYQGGTNAGHTVVVGEKELKLHLIPSGILYPGTTCILGNGMVIDPEGLVEELDYLEANGLSTANLWISDRAHLLLPYHKRLDELEEERRGENKIGTTRRGIGPAYMDKFARTGLRMVDLLFPEELRAKLQRQLEAKNHILEKVYGVQGFSLEEIYNRCMELARRFKDRITDTSVLIAEAIAGGKNLLFEGAQGTLLDVDHGTYPYVTSSYPTAGGACIGAGVGPTKIDKVIGVVKAYTTRVGEGPFPTELLDETGDYIRRRGHEFGTTTGRPRRCGWLDVVILRYAARVSGLDQIAVTKLDVLTGLETLKICTAYRYRGEVLQHFPANLTLLRQCEPVYEELPGWQEDISGCCDIDSLPRNARAYLERLAELVELPISIVSVGPRRDQTIVLDRVY